MLGETGVAAPLATVFATTASPPIAIVCTVGEIIAGEGAEAAAAVDAAAAGPLAAVAADVGAAPPAAVPVDWPVAGVSGGGGGGGTPVMEESSRSAEYSTPELYRCQLVEMDTHWPRSLM